MMLIGDRRVEMICVWCFMPGMIVPCLFVCKAGFAKKFA